MPRELIITRFWNYNIWGKVRAGAKRGEKWSQTAKKPALYCNSHSGRKPFFTMGVMSVRLYCFRQPSELQPGARSLEELQMESITIYFDAWESLDIDLRWWQSPRKCWGNQSGRCAGAMCESVPSAIKRIRNSQGHNGLPPLSWQSTI